jgi:hypothetical protein
LLQLDEKGEWLLNGRNLKSLQSLMPTGSRLYSITSGEVLRVHKGEIHAVAWVQASSDGDITKLLDMILDFWKMASLPVKEKEYANIPTLLQEFVINLQASDAYRKAFAGWSKPIWLTQFHPIAKNNPLPAVLEIAPAQPANVPVEAVKPTKTKAAKVRKSKSIAGAKNIVVPIKSVPEFFTSIKAAADYIGVTARTILNWKKRGWLKVEQNVKKIRIAKTDLDKCRNRQ